MIDYKPVALFFLSLEIKEEENHFIFFLEENKRKKNYIYRDRWKIKRGKLLINFS